MTDQPTLDPHEIADLLAGAEERRQEAARPDDPDEIRRRLAGHRRAVDNPCDTRARGVGMTEPTDLKEDEWAYLVARTLSDHPDWAAVTIQAMQAGILAALDRRGERLADVSVGLVEALNTKLGNVRRDHGRIVTAIEASTFHPTKWSAEAIAKEQKA